jgi:hypothetical protein
MTKLEGMTNNEVKRFVIRTLEVDSEFVIHSLFTAENEMSVMPASAQAFIACET